MVLLKLKRLSSLFLCAVMISATVGLSGCRADDFSVYFGITAMPVNIDPQLASSYSELLTVRNCFRGLMKLGKNDEPEYDLAESCDISADGLEYTFKLKQSEWSDGTELTAEDFVFALQRATDPATKAPYANLLMNIKGAGDRLGGGGGEPSVFVENGNVLKIVLEAPDKNFLSKLTNAVFMPCSKTFFEKCGGKYGLGKSYILTNGGFKVAQWSDGSYIKLSRSGKTDGKAAGVGSVILTVSSTGKDNISRIRDKEIGMTVDSSHDYAAVDRSAYAVETLYKKNYAIVFNKSTEIGSNVKLTSAFSKSIHRELYASRLNSRFLSAGSVLPADSVIFDKKISDLIKLPEYGYIYSPDEARTLFLEGVSELKDKKLPAVNILTVDNDEVKSVLTDVVSRWQSNLGAYVNLTPVPTEDELLKRVKNGDYTVAFVPFSDNSASILGSFSSKSGSGMSIYNGAYDEAAGVINGTDDLQTAVAAAETALNILSSEPSVIPIFSSPSAYIWDSNYKNVCFSNEYGTVDFSIIYK